MLLAHPKLVSSLAFTSCTTAACVWAFHLVEMPIIVGIVLVSLRAVLPFSPATLRQLLVLIGFATAAELAFFSFESVIILTSTQRGAPMAETLVYSSSALLLLSGAGLGLWALLKVNDYLHPPLDPRFEHPQTEGELLLLVKKARAYGVQLRVRGAEHCKPGRAIHTDRSGQHINVQLDRYNQILEWDEARMRVTVQAGCHLGVDPNNPLSTKKNSLLWQLEKRGWALPDLGGQARPSILTESPRSAGRPVISVSRARGSRGGAGPRP